MWVLSLAHHYYRRNGVQSTTLCSGLSSPEGRLQVESAPVLIVFMATANIGMANLERLITALIL